MNGEPITRVQELFEQAMELPPAERLAFVVQACGQDDVLKREVESLLAAHEQAGDFLPEPPTAQLPAEQGTTSQAISTALREGPGTKIGRYKLLQLIGEGGFGSVFMAEQESPVRRRVAVKIIKVGMDTRAVIARFEAERQALAIMDHPNIARVLDGGATETGRPYFVMELVRGEPITKYCDQNNLSIPDRLDLFIQVCHAVQHAHQKGLIHRDLKPSNILVSTQDGRSLVKIIDFGIAKATQTRLTDKTLFTEFRQLIGTPAYMSPEQAEGGLDIDTRSDVYSLGALLYELLTGLTPLDAAQLRKSAYVEIQRIIRDVEPPKPSTRLTTMGATLTAVAAHRRMEPRRLSQLVRGELDWIAMKALDKDRARRYESAAALASDVSRYLADDVVLARPASAVYRMRKTFRRHRAACLTGLTMFVLMTAGVIVTTRGMAEQRRLRLAAEEAKDDADTANAYLLGAVHNIAVDIQRLLHETQVPVKYREKMLAEVAAPLEWLRNRPSHMSPETQREYARVCVISGDLSELAGDYKVARLAFETACLNFESLINRRQAADLNQRELARALCRLTSLHLRLNELKLARKCIDRAMSIASQQYAANQGKDQILQNYWETLVKIGDVLLAESKPTEARQQQEAALRLIEQSPASVFKKDELSRTQKRLARTLIGQAIAGDAASLSRARDLLNTAMSIDRARNSKEANDVSAGIDLSEGLTLMAEAEWHGKQLPAARTAAEEAVQLLRGVLSRRPDETRLKSHLAGALFVLGLVHESDQRLTDALAAFEETKALLQRSNDNVGSYVGSDQDSQLLQRANERIKGISAGSIKPRE